MSDEQETEQAQAWPFAPSYEASYSSLPPSQLREAVKRLSERRRNPLPAEKLSEENPEVEGVLAAVKKAYLAKKDRAKQASAIKRAQQREAKPDNIAVEVEAEVEPAVEDLSASVADLSLEPAEVVAVEPAPEPAPEPEPVKPAASKPIPIPVPTRIPLVRQQTQQPPPAAAAAPRNQSKKSGLAGRFAVGEPPHPRVVGRSPTTPPRTILRREVTADYTLLSAEDVLP